MTRRIFIGLLLSMSVLCLSPSLSLAALAVDATANGTSSGSGPFTLSHTVTGSETLLVVGVSHYDSSDTVTGVTYNGVSMTEVPSGSVNNGQYYVDLFYLINPTTGTNNVSVSVSGSVFEIGYGSVSFTGAHQSAPLGTAVTATGSDTTPTATVSSASGELVVDTITIVHSGTLGVGAGQTSRWNAVGTSGFTKYAGSTEPGAGSVTMSWTNSTSQAWASVAVPIKPSSGASAVVPTRLLMGVGP